MPTCVWSVVVEYIETGSGETEKLTALESSKVSQESVRTIFSGLHTILSAALKQPSLKTEVGDVVVLWVNYCLGCVDVLSLV